MRTKYRLFLRRLLLLWVACAGLLVTAVGHAGYLYRFVNEQGKTEISSAVPNERVKYGYDILDSQGRVVQRIEAELSPEAQAAKRAREAERARCLDAYRRVSSLYQYESEIDRHKAKALEALSIAIENDQANLNHVRDQHTNLLEQAARMERSGNQLSAMLISNIDRAAGQIAVLEETIVSRKSERGVIESRFEEERQVFLQGGCPAFEPAVSGRR